MLRGDHATGLLCYANVTRRSSVSFFISLRKADQRHDLAEVDKKLAETAVGYAQAAIEFVVNYSLRVYKRSTSNYKIDTLWVVVDC